MSEIYGGTKKWGYRPTRAWGVEMNQNEMNSEKYFSLKMERSKAIKKRIDASIGQEGRNQSYESEETLLDDFDEIRPPPDWVFCKDIYQIGGSGECSQIIPIKLCQFCLDYCLTAGVEVLYPYQIRSISLNKDKSLSTATLPDFHAHLDRIVDVNNIVIAAGAWSPSVFQDLFPKSLYVLPISSLAGFSTTYAISPASITYFDVSKNDPRLDTDSVQLTDALFVHASCDARWSPEVFSRANGKIYIAGLNEQGYHPSLSTMGPPIESRQLDVEYEVIRDQVDDELNLIYDSNLSTNFDEITNIATSLLGPEIVPIKRSVCLRPVTRKGEPIIEVIPPELIDGAKNVYMAAGHGPWGITLSSGTGKVIAELIVGGAQIFQN
ncbi:FAD dependent oxidoreductase-domain-containing protein [Lipomyces japonicus]|uniref:FAD dependent oxidoreductase-domain-containing protein n=1 Tax=Lipomyces japonicus TaxID=56871 RepID=UPI0034CEBD77